MSYCRGSPGAEGLCATAWLASLEDEERRAVEERWYTSLNAEQFRVLRMRGTESPHAGRYTNLFDAGTFLCAGCSQPLYESGMKFQSGHGWPAFTDSLPDAIIRRTARGKVEVACAGCGGHIGHIFRSSRYPPPNHERHCVNSASLRFVPADTWQVPV